MHAQFGFFLKYLSEAFFLFPQFLLLVFLRLFSYICAPGQKVGRALIQPLTTRDILASPFLGWREH